MPELPRNLPHLYLARKREGGAVYNKVAAARSSAAPAGAGCARRSGEIRSRRRHGRGCGRSARSATRTFLPALLVSISISNSRSDRKTQRERLENRQKHIELVAVRPESADSPARATVFVPDTAADHFLRKVEQYRDENTRTGKPKNEALIARIQSVALAAVRSVYTDDAALFPAAAKPIWWEIWLRQGHAESFDAVVQRLEIPAQAQKLVFPDREVRLIYGSEITIARLFVNTDSIAEIRRARDTPAQFMRWSNVEQAARAADLAGRVDAPENPQIAVCLLDTGVTQSHPLLSRCPRSGRRPGIRPDMARRRQSRARNEHGGFRALWRSHSSVCR